MCKAPGYDKSDDIPLARRLAMDGTFSHCPGALFAGTLVAWWMIFNTAVYPWFCSEEVHNVPTNCLSDHEKQSTHASSSLTKLP